MCVLPFFHSYGMNVLVNTSPYNRLHIVTMPTFDLPRFLELHQVHDITSLTTVLSGASALDEKLSDAVQERLGVAVLQGFGMRPRRPR